MDFRFIKKISSWIVVMDQPQWATFGIATFNFENSFGLAIPTNIYKHNKVK